MDASTEDKNKISHKYDLFLCFHDSDVEQANMIVEYCEKVENGGFKCYHADRDSSSGPFSEVYKLAFDTSKMTVLLISKRALIERWFDILMNESLFHYVYNKKLIISVLIDDIHELNFPEMLSSFYKLKFRSEYFWHQLKETLKNTRAAAAARNNKNIEKNFG